jgi:hypothetical protein
MNFSERIGVFSLLPKLIDTKFKQRPLSAGSFSLFHAVFRIHIHLIGIRIQHFRLNTDPDPGFDDQKLEKFTAGKKFKFF